MTYRTISHASAGIQIVTYCTKNKSTPHYPRRSGKTKARERFILRLAVRGPAA